MRKLPERGLETGNAALFPCYFLRQETASCSEMVLFPDFNKSARLPTGETVSVELVHEKPGEYDFQCQMGMLHGKLIVE